VGKHADNADKALNQIARHSADDTFIVKTQQAWQLLLDRPSIA
jgi:hypothetical protein